jgi:hypothetical protein
MEKDDDVARQERRVQGRGTQVPWDCTQGRKVRARWRDHRENNWVENAW